MPIIGVIGRKGGSGKTTIAVHLAAELANNRSVALLDCDPQGSAALWAEPGQLPMPVRRMPLESDAETVAWGREVRAVKADITVLDAPPHLNAALGAVIGMADLVVIPCGPSGLDLVATAETVGLVREIRARRGDGRPAALLVPNRVDRRTASGRELAEALKKLGEVVAEPIGMRTAFSDSFNAGQHVGAYAPRSLAHNEIQVLVSQVLVRLKGLKR